MRNILRRILALPFMPLRLLPPRYVSRGISLAVRLATVAAPARWAAGMLLHLRNALDVMISTEATRLEGGVHPKHRLTDYHRFFWERLRPGERVLDIGSGVGALAYDMAEHGGAEVTGVELSPKNHALAVERFSHPHVRHILGDVFTDLPAGSYDTAVMSNVLEHIEDRPGFLRKVQGTHTPKRWLLRIPARTRDWTVPFMDELGIDSRLDSTHFTEYSEQQLHDELAAAGLRITQLMSVWGELWCEAVPAP